VRLFSERFRVLVVCRDDDRRFLSGQERIHVIPNGSHPIAARRCVLSERPRIGFIGNFTSVPNRDGVKWFIRTVWPMIKREVPAAELRLVGRESLGHGLTEFGPDIVARGWLEDPGTEISSCV